MELNAYKIRGFKGGIADDAYKGVLGSFRFGYGLNIRSENDTLKCNQALKKDSGSVVTDLILFFVTAVNGNLYGFGNTGKIYRRNGSDGVWSLVYTDPDGAITGAAEYTNWNGSNYVPFLYWATETKLKRIPLSGDWSTDVSTFANLNGDPGWHTMTMAVGVLMICDGQYLALVDYEGNFNDKALDIVPGNRTKCLLPQDAMAIIGSTRGPKIEEGWLWTWDKIKPSWIVRRMIAEKGINSLIQSEFIIAQAGISGSLYYWDTANLVPLKKLPGGGWVEPGAVANFKGLPLLGVTGSNKCGVYSYGRLNKNDQYALNLEYIPSHGKMEGVSIGAVTVHGDAPFVAWKDGSTYGVDTVDDTKKAIGRYEGLVFDAGNPFVQKSYRFVKLLTKPLPQDCSIEIYYRLNESGDWLKAVMEDGAESFDKVGKTKAVFTIETGDPDEEDEEDGMGETYEVAVTLIPTGNETPDIVAVTTLFESAELL